MRRPAERAFVTGPPKTRFPAHIAERFTFIGICQLLGVVCKASQFQAQFTLRKETNNHRFFALVFELMHDFQSERWNEFELPKLSLRELLALAELLGCPSCLGDFHQITPASLKLK